MHAPCSTEISSSRISCSPMTELLSSATLALRGRSTRRKENTLVRRMPAPARFHCGGRAVAPLLISSRFNLAHFRKQPDLFQRAIGASNAPAVAITKESNTTAFSNNNAEVGTVFVPMRVS
eukprot:2157955-Pleurochrysis_carterae.AAC.1